MGNSEKPKEACGIFGVFGHKDAARLTYLGLYALQHRGQESAGIATFDGNRIRVFKDMGLVSDVFNEAVLDSLPGENAIGHVRYSTTGASLIENAQPLQVDYSRGQIAIAHNGNLVNAAILRDELEAYGSIFQTTMDSEIIVHLLAKPSYRTQKEAVIGTVEQLKGAFSVVLLSESEVIGVRDPHGFRPLCLGRIDGAPVLASESCAFDLIQAEFLREVEPGEVVFLSKDGVTTLKPFGKSVKPTCCVFEHIYFSRPDSIVFGGNVHQARKRLGMNLAREQPVQADIVIPVPDSGNAAALGFAEASGIPFESGFVRNHYVGRTFLQPSQKMRDVRVKIKLNPIKKVVEGKRLVVVDDSVVRGTTSRARVHTLRQAGAKEVHLRISCPPHISPCFYGIDFPSNTELIAAKHDLEEIRRFIQVESIGYLSIEGLLSSLPGKKDEYCLACFTGDYPVPPDTKMHKRMMEPKRRSR